MGGFCLAGVVIGPPCALQCVLVVALLGAKIAIDEHWPFLHGRHIFEGKLMGKVRRLL